MVDLPALIDADLAKPFPSLGNGSSHLSGGDKGDRTPCRATKTPTFSRRYNEHTTLRGVGVPIGAGLSSLIAVRVQATRKLVVLFTVGLARSS